MKTPQSHTDGEVAENRPRTERSDSKIDRSWRRDGHTSITIQVQERTYDKKYLTDSDWDYFGLSVKDHEELYRKTSKQFKGKVRKEYLWDRLASRHNLSVNVCYYCFFGLFVVICFPSRPL